MCVFVKVFVKLPPITWIVPWPRTRELELLIDHSRIRITCKFMSGTVTRSKLP